MRISDWSSDVCSSDLKASKCPRNLLQCFNSARAIPFPVIGHAKVCVVPVRRMRIAAYRACDPLDRLVFGARVRSEEHTSELQSLMRISSAVFCLKKKKRHDDRKTHRLNSS